MGLPPFSMLHRISKCRDLNEVHNHTNRPYALTSRLHNDDAMLGVKTCRAARTCCAGRAHWRSASQSVRGPGPTRRYGMQGLALWLHAWRWRTWQCHIWPPTRLGALLWRHMHKVYNVEKNYLMIIDSVHISNWNPSIILAAFTTCVYLLLVLLGNTSSVNNQFK